MIVANNTASYYYLGDADYPLPPGGSVTVPDDVYNNDDAVAKIINSLDTDNFVTVSSAPTGYPRNTGGAAVSIDASSVTNTPAGNIAATDVQTALNELDTEKTTAASVLTEIADQKRVVEILVTDPAGSAITTGDGKAYFVVPALLNGHNLVAVLAALTTVSSSGAPTIQIANVTDTVDMLSTRITIDANESTSATAATPAVIDTTHDDVATGDILRVDIDVAGTGAKGLMVALTFEAP